MLVDKKNFTKFKDQHEIQGLVQQLAHQINQDYEGEKLLLICVLKGGFMVAADLIRHLKVDVEVDFVRFTSYGKDRGSTGTVGILKDIQSDLRDRHALIVEQIIDSGRTLKFLYERVKGAQPLSVEVLTLLDKSSKRLVDVPVKYVGEKIDDQFLVGYGLDLEEYSRNLPDLYYLKYPN